MTGIDKSAVSRLLAQLQRLGVERLRASAFHRAFEGAMVPVFRRGRMVRIEHRLCDRVAIALLSGRNGSVAGQRERAVSRRKYRRMLLDKRAREAAEQRAAEAIRAEHQAILDRIQAERGWPVLELPTEGTPA